MEPIISSSTPSWHILLRKMLFINLWKAEAEKSVNQCPPAAGRWRSCSRDSQERRTKNQGQDGQSWWTRRPQTGTGRLRADPTKRKHSLLAHTRVPRHKRGASSCPFPQVTTVAEAPTGKQKKLQWKSPMTLGVTSMSLVPLEHLWAGTKSWFRCMEFTEHNGIQYTWR